ncbi:MAG TPA: hypothetical protein VMG82_35045 [Candidatus Sulfotelmatobacter sp.]|nr:hypothetical protein [Candidatus Sulfotelmatobacter sp.]
MPVTYSIDPARKLIRTTCSGQVTLQEIIDHFQTLGTDPRCAGSPDVMLDVSASELFPDSQNLARVVTELAKISDTVQFRLCAINAGQDTMFGMMRMFEVHAAKYFKAVRVFRNPADTEKWLDSYQVGDGPVTGSSL